MSKNKIAIKKSSFLCSFVNKKQNKLLFQRTTFRGSLSVGTADPLAGWADVLIVTETLPCTPDVTVRGHTEIALRGGGAYTVICNVAGPKPVR